jgi:hypothetical protein
MTSDRRFEQELPRRLEDLFMGPMPKYRDQILEVTARTGQRPAWTFLTRWLPVDIARQPAFARRLSWHAIGIVLALIALLVAMLAALVVGSRPHLPAPFGQARNGLIAYTSGGDIYTADPVTGVATAVVTGPEIDAGPSFSLDGSRIAFERQLGGGRSQVYVARSDGRDLTLVTPEPIALQLGDFGRGWEKYQFSPDGTSLLIATLIDGEPSITIAQIDGSGTRTLEVGTAASEPTFRPPGGAEVLFIGHGRDRGLYAVDVIRGTVRDVLVIPWFMDVAGASWSPDGEHISYWSWISQGVEGTTAKSHVINADGTGDIELPMPAGAFWNAHATWSNDGTQLFIARGHTSGNEDVRGVVLPADGSDVGIEVAPAGSVETSCCAAWMWSPDDSQLLGRSAGGLLPQQLVVIDVSTRTFQRVPWSSTSQPTWQRLAQ